MRFVGLAALFLGSVACSETATPTGQLGSLELAPCPDTDLAVCTTIEVPQVHADPNGPKLTLRVFVSRDFGGGEPLVYLNGGPGGSVGPTAKAGFGAYFAPILHRDIVMLEQRGNALSTPALECSFSDGETREQLAQCTERYKRENVRLEAFNTLESVEDVEDLRRALGAERIVLWGVSYGSLLAATIAREHPDRVAGLVLESSVLGDRPYRPIERLALRSARIEAFTQWLASMGIDGPGILATALERLKQKPITIAEGIVIDSADAMEEWLFMAMYSVRTAVLFVRALEADNSGDPASLDARFQIDGRGAREYLRDALTFDDDIQSTTNLVVNCYDMIRNWTDEAVASADPRIDAPEWRNLCAALPPPTFEQARFVAPASAPMPTLFLGGGLDATTPLAWAEEDRARFPRSQLVSFGCLGHGVAGWAPACTATMVSSFLGQMATFDATSSLPTSCAETRCTAGFPELERDLLRK